MEMKLKLNVINALNAASVDYRAFAQQQTDRGESANAADYRQRAEKCHDLARQVDGADLKP